MQIKSLAKLLISFSLTIGLIAFLAINADKGLDITDESYYILNAQYPADVKAAVSMFGYYTKLLYIWSDGSIRYFRILGILFLVLLSFGFSALLARTINTSVMKLSFHSHMQLCAIGVAGAMVYYYKWWLITPSYNWLALIAILITGIGLLGTTLSKTKAVRTHWLSQVWLYASAVFIGGGGFLAFMAKPTSAFVLAIVALYWLGVSGVRKDGIKTVLIAGIVALTLMLIHIIVVEGSVGIFVAKLQDGMDQVKILGGGHTFGNVMKQALRDLIRIPMKTLMLIPITLVFTALFLSVLDVFKHRFVDMAKSHLFAVTSSLAWLELWLGGSWDHDLYGYGITALFIAALLPLIAFWKTEEDIVNLVRKNGGEDLAKYLVLLFLFSMAYAFGSNNGLMRQASGSFIFFSIALMLVAQWVGSILQQKNAELIAMVLLFATSLIGVSNSYNKPYRLPAAIYQQTEDINFLGSRHKLKVDTKTASYIRNLQKIASDSGWQREMFLIDLTGGSPGANVILSGRFPGAAWLLGAYKGSAEFAQKSLSLSHKTKLEKSWVLTAPKGERELPDEILKNMGLNFPRAYQVVGKVRTGYRNEIQILWRPMRLK